MSSERKIIDSTADFERAIAESKTAEYVLRLYIAGSTPASTRAIENIKNICEKNLKGHYELEVIDLYQQPDKAKDEQIIVSPTLLKKLPLPLRRIVGDLSDSDRVLVGLNLQKKQSDTKNSGELQ